MLLLNDNIPPVERVELVPGVALYVRTATLIDHEAAMHDVVRAIDASRDGLEALQELGVPEVPVEAFADEAFRRGLGEMVYNVALAKRVLVRWEGIGDADGKPIDPSSRMIALLFREIDFVSAFRRVALRRVHRAFTEGNGSAPSRNGEGGMAPPTAGDAGGTTPPVPVASAASMASAAPNAATRH